MHDGGALLLECAGGELRLARQREKDIQRNLKSESRRPFFRRGR
jgi:hypothetical protein